MILLFIQVSYVPYVSNFNDLDTPMRIASKKTCYITTFIMCKFNVKLRHCIVFKIVQHPNVNSILPELRLFCNNCMHLIIVVVVHSGLHNTFVLLLSWRVNSIQAISKQNLLFVWFVSLTYIIDTNLKTPTIKKI